LLDHSQAMRSISHTGGSFAVEVERDGNEWNRENPHLTITPAKKQSRLPGEEAVEDEADTGKAGDQPIKTTRSRSHQRRPVGGLSPEFFHADDYDTTESVLLSVVSSRDDHQIAR